MFEQMSRFISRFRDLEQQEFVRTREEERRWKELKEKLSAHPLEEQQAYSRKCVAVTSLYEQAGASFVAANAAFLWSDRGVPVTLCELPGTVSYFYFALDFERRGNQPVYASPAILLRDQHLRIQIDPPLPEQQFPQLDTAEWLLRTSKDSPTVFIDLSSRWRETSAQRVFEMADEIWVVFDADLPRLTRFFLAEAAPQWWFRQKQKIRLIANKWSPRLSRVQVKKRVEGTVSLWNREAEEAVTIDVILPFIDVEKIAAAHVKASLLLELFPEEADHFQPLLYSRKGRML